MTIQPQLVQDKGGSTSFLDVLKNMSAADKVKHALKVDFRFGIAKQLWSGSKKLYWLPKAYFEFESVQREKVSLNQTRMKQLFTEFYRKLLEYYGKVTTEKGGVKSNGSLQVYNLLKSSETWLTATSGTTEFLYNYDTNKKVVSMGLTSVTENDYKLIQKYTSTTEFKLIIALAYRDSFGSSSELQNYPHVMKITFGDSHTPADFLGLGKVADKAEVAITQTKDTINKLQKDLSNASKRVGTWALVGTVVALLALFGINRLTK